MSEERVTITPPPTAFDSLRVIVDQLRSLDSSIRSLRNEIRALRDTKPRKASTTAPLVRKGRGRQRTQFLTKEQEDIIRRMWGKAYVTTIADTLGIPGFNEGSVYTYAKRNLKLPGIRKMRH